MSRSALSRMLLALAWPASWPYRLAVAVRNGLYDGERVKIRRFPHPVISVGNLTVGGSGKTPVVARIARHLIGKGWPVAVLSRGYGRRDAAVFRLVSDGRTLLADVTEAGDEPVELAASVEGLVVTVGADRFLAGQETLGRLGAHVLVLDDGFQHRRLFRDLDLVCVDAGEPPGGLRLLPAGRLREPLASLNRASAIIWTRWKPGTPPEPLKSRVLGALRREIPVFRARLRTKGFSPLGGAGAALPPEGLGGEPVGWMAAIARPERFEQDLLSTGARVVWSASRRDHHFWTGEEVAGLVGAARRRGARAVVTTAKDAVKLKNLAALPLPLYRMDLEVDMVEREAFEELLDRAVSRGLG